MAINPRVEHLMRRAGFGMGPEERVRFGDLSPSIVLEQLLDVDREAEDVDAYIGQSGYVGITTRGGPFSPNTNIEDARQRWLFRMIHTRQPLLEKMALFWHNHFATAYSKVSLTGSVQGVKLMALKAGELPGQQGQIDLLRQHALGNFRNLLFEVAKDPAMLVWLDGYTNTRFRPQENFGREIMELFTFGIGNYTEQDVYAAARVFTGWNLRHVRASSQQDEYEEFIFNANQHETSAKTFTFPIYSDGSKTIESRTGDAGMQDGIDLIAALAGHPNTARRLARKLWDFFISEVTPPPPAFVEGAASVYLENDTEMKPMVRYVLRSPWFQQSEYEFSRYSWPVEFVVRAIKEVGWTGFSVDTARTPLLNMGQSLFEPPDVNGWDLGQRWFSTGAMLARMNFAATLASNQRFNLARDVGSGGTPERLLGSLMDRFTSAPYGRESYGELMAYLQAGGAWTGSEDQVRAKVAGLSRLIVGSSEYQLV